MTELPFSLTDQPHLDVDGMHASGFGPHALPYGVVRRGDHQHVCVRLEQNLVDLAVLVEEGVIDPPFDAADLHGNLDRVLAGTPSDWAGLRASVFDLISAEVPLPDRAVKPLADATLVPPFTVADYVDFYSSIHHATNLGRLFRPNEDPLMPNWLRLPIGYHGRAGTVVPSGTPVTRPRGLRPNPDGEPTYGASRRLDIELEVGFVVGNGTELGSTVSVDDADQHVFGVTLVNDWSARDIQAYEYRPLGPFLGKSFATSMSHWVLPLAALGQARLAQPAQDPEPQPHLHGSEPWGLDLHLAVQLQTAAMRSRSQAPVTISRGRFHDLYWTFAQQLAHMTTNGASLRAGDLYASGTVSGPEQGSEGSLIELAWNGERPLKLPNDETRVFLEDGDRIILRGWAPGPGGRLVSLGEVDGQVLPARDVPA